MPEHETGPIDEVWLRTGDEGPTPQCVDLYLRLRHTERAERSQGNRRPATDTRRTASRADGARSSSWPE